LSNVSFLFVARSNRARLKMKKACLSTGLSYMARPARLFGLWPHPFGAACASSAFFADYVGLSNVSFLFVARSNRARLKMKKACLSTGLSYMARPARFERATAWFVARYSIQLSYGR
jgi:hypothetical protein